MTETIKKYEFRELKSEDIFTCIQVINKLDIENLISKWFDKDEISPSKKLMNVAGYILCNIDKCKNEIFVLLSSVSNLSKEEIKNMALAEFGGMLVEFFKKKEILDFFKVVLGSEK